MKSTKIDLKKKIITKIQNIYKKESKTLWITIVIHSAIVLGE